MEFLDNIGRVSLITLSLLNYNAHTSAFPLSHRFLGSLHSAICNFYSFYKFSLQRHIAVTSYLHACCVPQCLSRYSLRESPQLDLFRLVSIMRAIRWHPCWPNVERPFLKLSTYIWRNRILISHWLRFYTEDGFTKKKRFFERYLQ